MTKFWIKKTKKEIANGTHWAKLRTKKDEKTGEDYIDVLVGRKGQKWHAHYGINLDQTTRFKQFRNITRSVRRTVQSMQKGLVEDNEIVVDWNVYPTKTLVLRIEIGPNDEVYVSKFKL